jgi:hypothetical protein
VASTETTLPPRFLVNALLLFAFGHNFINKFPAYNKCHPESSKKYSQDKKDF